MNVNSFVRGMFIGMVAGVALDMVSKEQRHRRTTVGKAMERMGSAVDSALEDVKHCLK